MGGYRRNAWVVIAEIRSIQYVEGLYTSNSPEKQENYVLLNLNGTYRMNEKLDIWFRGENLLAQKYEIISGYPMPKAVFTGGLSINF